MASRDGFSWSKGLLYEEGENLSSHQRNLLAKLKNNVVARLKEEKKEGSYPVLQQSDLLRPFLVDIGDYGLNYAYHKYPHPQHIQTAPPDAVPKPGDDKDDPYEKYKKTKTERPIDILVIGAGLSGLSAAYELAQVGHNVTILEMQHRVGGRVKTIGDTHFYKGLWSDAGAMRLPGEGLDPIGPVPTGKPSHFMTDFYALQFKIPVIPFVNQDSNGYYKFYGDEKMAMCEWDKNKKENCDKNWPGWDSNLPPELKRPDFDIGAYFDVTVAPLKKQLEQFLTEDPLTAWERWLDLWTRFSLNSFLRTSYDELLRKLRQSKFWKDTFEPKISGLKTLLPWPQAAVTGYYTLTYVPSTHITIADFLRDDLGQWWKDPMHTYEDGLKMLPENFVKQNTHGWNPDVKLSDRIVFGQVAYKITYTPEKVTVWCRNSATMEKREFKADRVVITLPINILRGLTYSPPLPKEYYKAFEAISVEASTKVMLQCKTRFWEKDKKIQGGFTKTNMPISQIHYPSNPDFKIPYTERGILMCYTWKNEALLFGSQTKENAIAEVVDELSEVHPEITDQFEVGAVQSWYSDPSSQGAFVLPNIDEYGDIKFLLEKPHERLYFCGEAISFTNGWIQGAIESALIAAFQLYADNEEPAA